MDQSWVPSYAPPPPSSPSSSSSSSSSSPRETIDEAKNNEMRRVQSFDVPEGRTRKETNVALMAMMQQSEKKSRHFSAHDVSDPDSGLFSIKHDIEPIALCCSTCKKTLSLVQLEKHVRFCSRLCDDSLTFSLAEFFRLCLSLSRELESELSHPSFSNSHQALIQATHKLCEIISESLSFSLSFSRSFFLSSTDIHPESSDFPRTQRKDRVSLQS